MRPEDVDIKMDVNKITKITKRRPKHLLLTVMSLKVSKVELENYKKQKNAKLMLNIMSTEEVKG